MGLGSALLLRLELSERNRAYALKHSLPHRETYGTPAAIAYEPQPDGSAHGNFVAASYRAILADREWSARLKKSHTHKKRMPAPEGRAWCELDSCNSSDALLMNIFCYPGVLRRGRLASLLGVDLEARPQFGFPARVPLLGGATDRTEVDMRLGDLLVEAKLTESDFQTKSAAVVERYRDFADVFERRLLPRRAGAYASYQLIRNVLAAHATGRRLAVLLDARRTDLLEAWHQVQRAVRPVELRTRCQVLTWQEAATFLPATLRMFLREKYGIERRA